MKAASLRWSLIIALAALALSPLPAISAGLEVQRIVLGESVLGAGEKQLVQIMLHNQDTRPVTFGIRVEIRNRSRQRFGDPKTMRVRLAGSDDKRVHFLMTAPATLGDFLIKVEVLSSNFKTNVLPGRPVFYSPFQVLSSRALALRRGPAEGSQAAMRLPISGKPQTFVPPQGLAFESPDLLWENLNLDSPGILIGEPLKVRADLVNVGGDIARDIRIRVEHVNTRLPRSLKPITETTVKLLAPGDKIEMEFEYQFPPETLLGDYRIILTADADNSVDELNEENNRIQTQPPLRLAVIRQDFPPDKYEFQEAGLFLFRWNSKIHDEFKVQVSTERSFENPENLFEIPQGDKWTPDHEIVPLSGELPGMARGLMIKNKADRIYWRVLGRNSKTGKTANSLAFSFTMQIDDGIDEEAGEDSQGEGSTPGGIDTQDSYAPAGGGAETNAAQPALPGSPTPAGNQPPAENSGE